MKSKNNMIVTNYVYEYGINGKNQIYSLDKEYKQVIISNRLWGLIKWNDDRWSRNNVYE